MQGKSKWQERIKNILARITELWIILNLFVALCLCCDLFWPDSNKSGCRQSEGRHWPQYSRSHWTPAIAPPCLILENMRHLLPPPPLTPLPPHFNFLFSGLVGSEMLWKESAAGNFIPWLLHLQAVVIFTKLLLIYFCVCDDEGPQYNLRKKVLKDVWHSRDTQKHTHSVFSQTKRQ